MDQQRRRYIFKTQEAIKKLEEKPLDSLPED